MSHIESSQTLANEAISQLVGIDASQVENKQVTLSYTTDITGMINAQETANTMLKSISDFSQAVLLQADKFPQIATLLEERDIAEAQRWES